MVCNMKKNNKGFIATSLIYSFFLVFLALLLAILSTYITTNRILYAYNKSIRDKLNSVTYIPEIYAIGSDCFVEKGVSMEILNTCFKTYNMVDNPNQESDYVCYYTNNPASTIYNTQSLAVSTNPYIISCKVRNANIDERYISATTNIYVVDKLNPEPLKSEDDQ